MTIKFSPEALERVATGNYVSKRLKNRWGEARCETCCAANQTELLFSGPLLDVLAAAEAHEVAHQGQHNITVHEDTCGNLVS